MHRMGSEDLIVSQRITAATFPKPTEVSDVMAKNSAVMYFDFKSGPLNVSFTTRNESVHIAQ
jgi:hypothetical protein